MVSRHRWILLFGPALCAAVFLLAGCAPDGAALYERERCGSCHRFRGEGGNLGPDLTAVAARRSAKWIRRQITHPERNNPDTRMPGFPHMKRREVRAIAGYLSP